MLEQRRDNVEEAARRNIVELLRAFFVVVSLILSTTNVLCVEVNAFASSRPFTNHRQQRLFASSSQEEEDAGVVRPVGAPASVYFTPKLIDGLKFNLFGIGRQDDEDKIHGAYQPPPNSMVGKVVVITGASAGLGLESAKRLALAGATVVLTARTDEKVALSVDAVEEYCRGVRSSPFGKTGRATSSAYVNLNPNVVGITLDLDDLSSVRSFPKRYVEAMIASPKEDNERIAKIDVLMNNAGGGGYPSREITVDGYERTFQSCHLGHFVLTARLFQEGLLNQSTDVDNNGCTVINVSSVSHKCAEAKHSAYGGISEEEMEFGYDFDNMQCEITYSGEAYFQGKLANVLFTKELQRRADIHNQQWLRTVSLEPGGVTTDIWRHVLGYDPQTFAERCANGERLEVDQPKDNSFAGRLATRLFYRFGTQVERGANVQIWLAYLATISNSNDADKSIIRGGHYDEYRTSVLVPEFADNEDTSRRLWEMSEEMAGQKFDLAV